MFELGSPWWALLLPLPLIMRWLPPAAGSNIAIGVPFYRQVRALTNRYSATHPSGWLQVLTLWCLWVSLVLAACDPRWVGDPRGAPYSGRDMMMAIDISRSMERKDMLPPGVVSMQFQNAERYNRLQAVKAVVGDFVSRRSGDRLGLILFADRAYLQAPLTHDIQTVNQLLQEAQIGFAGSATAIGDAIGLAIKRLQDRPESSRRIILLSDGANTAGNTEPLEAADIAADMGVKIYTIAFGSTEQIAGVRRRNMSADLDVETLQAIARKTGGDFFRAESTEELIDVHKQLDALEPVELDELTVRPVNRLFYWPLALALILSALLALPRTQFARPPVRTGSGGDR